MIKRPAFVRRMGDPRLSNERGMALLLTLAIATILIAGALELNRRVRTAVVATAHARDGLTLAQMAASGIHVGMSLLIDDKNKSQIDSIQEDWADEAKIAELLAEIPFEEGAITLTIADELGKIQVNALVDFPKGQHFNQTQHALWDRFLRQFLSMDTIEALGDDEDTRPPAVINSIKDWLDSGDDDAMTGISGAEADYYEELDPPYKPANGPFLHVAEVLRVKGVGKLHEAIKEQLKLEDLLTVYGMEKSQQTVEKRSYSFSGKVNINTADLPVLMALIPSDNPEYAQAVINYRSEKEDEEYLHDLTSPTWYKNAPDYPGDLTIDPNLITVVSDTFRIRSTAKRRGQKRTVTAIVQREQAKGTGKWTCRVLNWRTE